MGRMLSILAAPLLAISIPIGAQSPILNSYMPLCDSLKSLIHERTTVLADIRLHSVMRRNGCLDFYFTQSLGDIPWTQDDVQWLKKTLHDIAPESCSQYKIGNIFSGRTPVGELVFPEAGNDGRPAARKSEVADRREEQLVRNMDEMDFNKGMTGRHIALWQSHGRYYESSTRRWEWQRATLFTTVEDMYTQSYVLPFLIPMLENAGAYVMTPRERDTQKYEVITDNDPSFGTSRQGLVRRLGTYSETGSWNDAGTGFADFREIYSGNDNPFTAGTARSAKCTKEYGGNAVAKWTPDIPERGRYAVYVSWKTLPNSSESAHYSVRHLGGTSHFIVNQKMGGGTWIYLGTFEFEAGTDAEVRLDNGTCKGCTFVPGSIVTADAVRIGGGMGKIARGNADMSPEEYTVSGLPSFTEGALYSMQWAGIDTTVTRRFEDDYTNDYADRGAWVCLLSGGSRVNPGVSGKGIPFDLSLAFHTDAGITPNDSIVGTLSIYTLRCDGERKYPNGEDRIIGRQLSGYVQSQVVSDIRHQYEPEWSRRQLADRSYSESRTTGVPGTLLELLSHQNFADMKYGLDPAFRFTVSRAVYKGMLKFLSSRYGCAYEVQPLPVNSFSAIVKDGKVRLGWKETADTLEPTASAKGFILYTRVDDGGFDNGTVLRDVREEHSTFHVEVPLEKGHIYSYRIVAYNDGGKSFPSETLCVGIAESTHDDDILIINNFTRVAPPAWFDSPLYAGFDDRLDAGVPYIQEINRIGEMYQWRRTLSWSDDDNPGFGASYTDSAGRIVAGNTFDFPYIHGKALMKAGYSFSSCSAAAFSEDSESFSGFWVADIICGKQVTTPAGRGAVQKSRFQVFPSGLRSAINGFTSSGGNILVSGANIGTDLWDCIYPVGTDSTYQAEAQQFARKTLGYRWLTNYASRSGKVWGMRNRLMEMPGLTTPFSFCSKQNSRIYNVETPDGILPASDSAATFLRYTDTSISAGVCYDGNGYRSACIGFPIEIIQDEEALTALMNTVLDFFKRRDDD